MSECRQATAERLGSRAWGSEDRVRSSLNCCATGEEDKPANEAERKQKNERPSQLPKEIGSQRKWLTESAVSKCQENQPVVGDLMDRWFCAAGRAKARWLRVEA